jgi:Uma2 family endonuclease
MATTTTGLMTFAQFEQMPDDGRRYELRHGEPIEVPPPIHRHFLIQRRLRRLLEALAGSAGMVETEWGFRPTQEYEYRRADVAFVSQHRVDDVLPDGHLMGAPEMVVEVLSPSNRRGKIAVTQSLCLENGCREFWVVDPKRRSVTVSTPDGTVRTYLPGEQIPLMFGGELAVADIFE